MIRKRFCLFGLITLLLYSTVLHASPSRAQTTLASLLAGETLIVGDKVFSKFRNFATITTGGAAQPNPANIQAFPLNDDPLNPGITWVGGNSINLVFGPPAQAEAGEWDVNAGQTQTTSFTYDVSTLSGVRLIKDNSLRLGGAGVVNPGEVHIGEIVTDSSGDALGEKEVFLSTLVQEEDHIDFAPQNFITVQTTITLDSHTNGAAGLVSFTQRFSQLSAPEPGTGILLSGGLIGVGLLRLRRRK